MPHENWPFRKPYLAGQGRLSRGLTIFSVCQISRLILALTQRSVRIEGMDNLVKFGIDQMPRRPLITVSTHTATIDDAVLWSLLPWRYQGLNPDKFRWVLGAQGN